MGRRGRPTAAVKGPSSPADLPDDDLPVPPDSCVGEARREWARVIQWLGPSGVLSKIDESILYAYCTAYAGLREADEAIRKDGPSVVTDRGPVKSLWLTIRRQQWDQLRQSASMLGFSPTDRAKLRGTKASAGAELARFIGSQYGEEEENAD